MTQHQHISVTAGFDNSNPPNSDWISWSAGGECVIRQFMEPAAPRGYSFHLHVQVANCGSGEAKLPLVIKWAESDFDYCRYHLFLGLDSGASWLEIPISSQHGVTWCEVVVPPGRHRLCCSPSFDTADLESLLNVAADRMLWRCEVAASTVEGRPIYCLRGGKSPGFRVVVTTRAHPYETSGPHCLAGWIGAADAQDLNAMDVYLFPCLNPDGVVAGNGALSPSGVNYGNQLATVNQERDSGAASLAAYIRDIQPHVYLDMHNYYRLPYVDSFRCNDAAFLEHFRHRAPTPRHPMQQWEFRKYRWDEGYLPRWCERHYGTLAVLTEFPWHQRTAHDMRAYGREFMTALLGSLQGWRQVPTRS